MIQKRRWSTLFGTLTGILLLSGCGSSDSTSEQQEGTIYRNAKIYTQNNERAEATTMVVEAGRFVYVGDENGAKAYKDQGLEVVDLGGRMVLPGLHDNHIHTFGTVALDQCDLLSEGVNLDQLKAHVDACLPKYAPAAGDWLIVNQWVPYEGNEPTASFDTVIEALDAAAPNNPVVLKGVDGHASAYNSLALSLAQDSEGNTVGFSVETLAVGAVFESFAPYVNLSSGVIREDARAAIPTPDTDLLSANSPEAEQLYSGILPQVSELLASRGITSIQDACASEMIQTLFEKMQTQNLLHMRVTAASCFVGDDYAGVMDIAGHINKANAIRDKWKDNPLLKADAVKIFIDGVLEGDPFSAPPFAPNAGMLKNYQIPHLHYDEHSGDVTITANSEDSGQNGIVNYESDDLKNYVTELDRAGFSVHMHSIGDRSTRVAIDALQAARERNGASGIPHTIAHLQMVHPDDQSRLGQLGVYLTFTYAWIGTQPQYDVLVTPFLEPSVAGQDINSLLYNASSYSWSAVYPVETSRLAGATLVAGSDAPVDSRDPRPFVNIAAGVTRASSGGLPYNAAQRTSLAELLAAYTINGARATRRDSISGSIEKNKSADFIVLDQNLFDLVASGHADKIADTQVERTVFQGTTVWSAEAKK